MIEDPQTFPAKLSLTLKNQPSKAQFNSNATPIQKFPQTQNPSELVGKVFYMLERGDDVIIVRPIARGVAAEKNLRAVELQRVVKRVEELRRNQIPRHKYIRSFKHFRRHIQTTA